MLKKRTLVPALLAGVALTLAACGGGGGGGGSESTTSANNVNSESSQTLAIQQSGTNGTVTQLTSNIDTEEQYIQHDLDIEEYMVGVWGAQEFSSKWQQRYFLEVKKNGTKGDVIFYNYGNSKIDPTTGEIGVGDFSCTADRVKFEENIFTSGSYNIEPKNYPNSLRSYPEFIELWNMDYWQMVDDEIGTSWNFYKDETLPDVCTDEANDSTVDMPINADEANDSTVDMPINADEQAPTYSTIPSEGDAITGSAVLRITFNESVSGVGSGTSVILRNSNGAEIAMNLLEVSGNDYYFDPNPDLTDGTYYLSIGEGGLIANSEGNIATASTVAFLVLSASEIP